MLLVQRACLFLNYKHLCTSLLIGPRWPNPEAIVFISTCFQQQKGRSHGSQSQVVWHLLSNITSERSSPNDIGFITSFVSVKFSNFLRFVLFIRNLKRTTVMIFDSFEIERASIHFQFMEFSYKNYKYKMQMVNFMSVKIECVLIFNQSILNFWYFSCGMILIGLVPFELMLMFVNAFDYVANPILLINKNRPKHVIM